MNEDENFIDRSSAYIIKAINNSFLIESRQTSN